MLVDLEQMLRLFYRLSPGHSSGLERALGKSTNVHSALMHLSDATSALRDQLDPYCRARSNRASFDEDCEGASCSSASGETVAVEQGMPNQGTGISLPSSALQDSMAVELNADRIVFKHPPQFKASKFLTDPLLKAGFADPSHLVLPEENWPKVRPARVLCSRDELLKLFRKWDSVHSLRLLDCQCSERKYRCGLFAVYKSAEKDRQILNPTPENGRRMVMNQSTLSLSHGSLLCSLYLEHDKDLVIGADDLEDFYHSFIVDDPHAFRNHIHGVFPADMFKGWNCWRDELEGKHVVGCFGSLAMGTSFAVEVAQHTHSILLQRAGCLNSDEWVQYRKEFPAGDTYQLLCIDDYAVLHKVPRGTSPNNRSDCRKDRKLLDQANAAYAKADLRSSAKKAVRDSFNTVVLGGQIDGRRGLVCAPRLRILVLCNLSLKLVQIGYSTKQLLETIVGSWIFVLMFRRPLLSLLSDVFHEGEKLPRREIFQLSTGAKQELLLLCICAPFAYTNLRASPLDKIFCSDASIAGGGVCSADISQDCTLELCRVSEQRGFYTRIDNNSALGAHMALQGEYLADASSIPKSLVEGFLWDFCEVFRGTGHLSNAHREQGLTVHPGFDLLDGACGDVLLPSTLQLLSA